MTNTLNNMHNGHALVDLGLPSGLLWATCNVGATSPAQTGLYFAWGETTGFTIEKCLLGVRKFNKSSYKAKKIKKTSLSNGMQHTAAWVVTGGCRPRLRFAN